MAETLTDSGAVKLKAGSGALALTSAEYTLLINNAEGVIASTTRNDWVDSYAGLSANVKNILDDTASNLAGIHAVTFDMDAAGVSRIEAEDRINVLRDGALRNLSILRDKKVQDFINGV